MKYLVFRLYGPMAAWGEIAVGESRHSAVYPSKSALLGLLAAALGIRRDEEELQTALAAGYQFAVKVLRSGSLLRDYHTTQVPPSAALHRSIKTRKEELSALKEYIKTGVKSSGTILSTREYLCDAMAMVAVRPLDSAPYSLEHLSNKLLKPEFHLYLGRKSCPLAAPLDPVIDNWDSFGEAFTAVKPKGLSLFPDEETRWLPIDSQVRYYWEGDDPSLTPQQVLVRHDQPTSRSRWQFTRRAENLFIGKEQG